MQNECLGSSNISVKIGRHIFLFFAKKVLFERLLSKVRIFFATENENMATEVNKHEVKTTVVLKRSEEETYYLFVRKDKSDAWSLPSSTVGSVQSIEETANNVLKLVRSILDKTSFVTFVFYKTLFCYVLVCFASC